MDKTAKQAELDELIKSGMSNLAKAGDPNTPSPLQTQMDLENPSGGTNVPPTTGPIGSENKAKDIEEESAFAKWGNQQVAGDRVFASEALRGWPETVAAKIKGTTREQEVADTELARLQVGQTADATLSFAGQVMPYLLLPNKGGIINAGVEAGLAGLADTTIKAGAEERLPAADEAVVSTLMSAGGGVLGNVVGRGIVNQWSKLTNGREALPASVRLSTSRAAKATDAAGKAMDSSGLTIKADYLNALSKQITKNFAEVTPEGTPGAWQALQRARSGLEGGRDLTIRQLDELRKGIYKIKADSFEKKYVRDIYKTLNTFMKELPNRPGAVASGDVTKGVTGWSEMNKLAQNQLRLDAFAQKMSIAEMKARTGKVPLDRALQDQFSQWTTTKSGIKEFDNLFGRLDKETQDAIKKLGEGSFATKQMNKLDKTFGGGWINTVMRTMRSSLAHSAAGPAAKEAAGQAFGALPGGIAPGNTAAQAVSRAVGAGSIAGAQDLPQPQTPSLGGLMAPRQ